ncbi:MAG TPA: hypothetical protein VFZ58_03255 [Candidatus Saccharimonadales bacterium]
MYKLHGIFNPDERNGVNISDLWWLFAVIILIALAAAGWFFFRWHAKLKRQQSDENEREKAQKARVAALKRKQDQLKGELLALKSKLDDTLDINAAALLLRPAEDGQSKHDQLVARANQCKLPKDDLELLEELRTMAHELLDFEELQRLLDDFRAQGEPHQTLEALMRFYAKVDEAQPQAISWLVAERRVDLSQEARAAQLDHWVRKVYWELRAQLNSEEGVRALFSFYQQWKDTVQLTLPQGWIELVVQYVPSLPRALLVGDIVQNPVEILTAAVEAMDSDNPILAAQVLSLASEQPVYFCALGGLTPQLTKLVYNYRKAFRQA